MAPATRAIRSPGRTLPESVPNRSNRSDRSELSDRSDRSDRSDLSRAEAKICRAWIAEHSKSFYLSSLLFPRRVREAAWALYAFCRRADDAVDETGEHGSGPTPERAVALRRVDSLRRRLDRAYGDGDDVATDSPDAVIDRAFARIARRYAIDRALPEALLDGMAMDAEDRRYRTIDELYLYCFRVAATVGLMMSRVMGVSDDRAYARATDLGVAMQLTNIARDVGEDARRGRVYLPDDLLAEHQIDRQAVLSAHSASNELRQAVRQLLERADAHYRAADLGVPLLPRSCRWAIASARRIYAAIGDAVARRGWDSITGRARVGLAKKLWLVFRSLGAALPRTTIRRGSVGPGDATLVPLIIAVGLPAPRALVEIESVR